MINQRTEGNFRKIYGFYNVHVEYDIFVIHPGGSIS